MFDEDTILQIWGSCDYDSQKCLTKTQFYEFEGPAIAMGEIGWRRSRANKWNSDQKNQKRRFDFFGHNFCYPPTPIAITGPSNRDITSSSNSFKNLKFSKMFNKDAILQIQGSCDCDGSGWVIKIAAEKTKTSVRYWKKHFLAKSTARLHIRVWARQVARLSLQTSSHLA